ncbi:hypothetical protein Pcac1_g3583 [Phytophthora cactorum]|nr:hypothetical protein Pcac1_g3583 [Phytophthora cactorum]
MICAAGETSLAAISEFNANKQVLQHVFDLVESLSAFGRYLVEDAGAYLNMS